jgi:hypothetical protein
MTYSTISFNDALQVRSALECSLLSVRGSTAFVNVFVRNVPISATPSQLARLVRDTLDEVSSRNETDGICMSGYMVTVIHALCGHSSFGRSVLQEYCDSTSPVISRV